MKNLITICFAFLFIQAVVSQDDRASTLVYISSYATPDADSIYLYRLNTATGELKLLDTTKGVFNPSFIVFNSDHNRLYAVNEDENLGAVDAFSVNFINGKLTQLNSQPSPGGPCYVSLDHTNEVVFSADYNDGNVRAFPVQKDGSLGSQSGFDQHNGSSINPDRQAGPHAHMIIPDPANKFMFSVDLGMDQVLGYILDAAEGTIVHNDPFVAYNAEPGAGPRHLAFHPNGQFAYLIHEMGSIIAVLSYDAEQGTFTEVQTVSTLPSDYTEPSTGAAIHLSTDGKFLYASNRGHNSIAVFSIDQDSFQITNIQFISTQGNTPRDFNLDFSGKIIIATNQDSNNTATYLRDAETGLLTESGFLYNITSSPTCVQSIPDTIISVDSE